jgi:hypothetical protein
MRIVCLALAFTYIVSGECHSPGAERWPIKTSIATSSNTATGKPVQLGDLMKLENPPGAKNNDPTYQSKRFPAFKNNLGVNEGEILTVTGYLYLVATEDNDCEYHIQLSNQPRSTTDKPQSSDECLIVEVARPDAFSDAALQQKAQAVRDYIKTKLLANAEPGPSGNVMQHAVYVQVRGQLFFDDAHLKKDGTPELRGKRNMKSATLWELHPIVDFKIIQAPK